MFIVPTAIQAIDNFIFTLAGTASDVGFSDFFALNGSDIIDGATFQCTGGCSLVENILPASFAAEHSADLAAAVPEPASMSLFGAGLIGLGPLHTPPPRTWRSPHKNKTRRGIVGAAASARAAPSRGLGKRSGGR